MSFRFARDRLPLIIHSRRFTMRDSDASSPSPYSISPKHDGGAISGHGSCHSTATQSCRASRIFTFVPLLAWLYHVPSVLGRSLMQTLLPSIFPASSMYLRLIHALFPLGTTHHHLLSWFVKYRNSTWSPGRKFDFSGLRATVANRGIFNLSANTQWRHNTDSSSVMSSPNDRSLAHPSRSPSTVERGSV